MLYRLWLYEHAMLNPVFPQMMTDISSFAWHNPSLPPSAYLNSTSFHLGSRTIPALAILAILDTLATCACAAAVRLILFLPAIGKRPAATEWELTDTLALTIYYIYHPLLALLLASRPPLLPTIAIAIATTIFVTRAHPISIRHDISFPPDVGLRFQTRNAY